MIFFSSIPMLFNIQGSFFPFVWLALCISLFFLYLSLGRIIFIIFHGFLPFYSTFMANKNILYIYFFFIISFWNGTTIFSARRTVKQGVPIGASVHEESTSFAYKLILINECTMYTFIVLTNQHPMLTYYLSIFFCWIRLNDTYVIKLFCVPVFFFSFLFCPFRYFSFSVKTVQATVHPNAMVYDFLAIYNLHIWNMAKLDETTINLHP